MSRTVGSYIPAGRATIGLGATDPSGGLARATRGLVINEPEAAPVPELQDPPPLISTGNDDSNGTPVLLSDFIEALDFSKSGQQRFYNPDREYTGYAADGFWYKDGRRDPADAALEGKPFLATWYEETDSINRGVQSQFPRRIIVVGTDKEVVIINADTIDVWMRFELRRSSVPALGPLAGRSITLIRGVRFVDGFLLIATNDGLRIADFRQDRGMFLGEVSWFSTTGLAFRNEDTYLDGVSDASPTKTLFSDVCNSVDARVWAGWKAENDLGTLRQLTSIAVVGQSGGLCAISLDIALYPDPRVVKHPVGQSLASAWSVEDDGDIDPTSPFFQDAGTNWLGLRVQQGDVLDLDTTAPRTVTEVQQVIPGNRLVVEPELLLTDSGFTYNVVRSIGAVYLSPELDLYFANGTGSVAVNRTQDWFETRNFTSPVPLFNDLIVRGNVSQLAFPVAAINDMDKRADRLYIATSIGVFSVTDGEMDEDRRSEFLYSTPAVTEAEATFKILEGEEKNVAAVAVDPETGNVTVAVTESASVVTEINPNIQQAFRFYDNVGRVKALVAYRNPDGPPDEVP